MNLQTPSTTLLLLLLLLLHAAAAPPPPPSDPPCSDELEEFSICLPFISSSPNNPPDTPPAECCDGFVSAFSSNTSACLCSLLRQNLILGFPVNSSRFFSLPLSCAGVDKRFRVDNSGNSLCPGSPVLPPLHSITGPWHGPPKSHPEQQSQAHITDAEPNSERPTSTRSSIAVLMTNNCRWVPLSVMFFFTYMVVL